MFCGWHGFAPGKSGLHARGEGERVLALESREGTRASSFLMDIHVLDKIRHEEDYEIDYEIGNHLIEHFLCEALSLGNLIDSSK